MSVFNAELYAINKALNNVSPRLRKSFFWSHSRSALQALEYMYSRHPIVADIHTVMVELLHRGTRLSLCWIPSHVGFRHVQIPLPKMHVDNLPSQTMLFPQILWITLNAFRVMTGKITGVSL